MIAGTLDMMLATNEEQQGAWVGASDDIASLHHDMLSHLPDDIGPTRHALMLLSTETDGAHHPHDDVSPAQSHGEALHVHSRGWGESRFRHSEIILSTLSNNNTHMSQTSVMEIAWEPPRKSHIVKSNLHDWTF